ncbi:MAG: M1 family metallopeptidase [Acidobacteria bacterium]|nr:M1 family metallopeptidase [Acidobacteriota bacterium]
MGATLRWRTYLAAVVGFCVTCVGVVYGQEATPLSPRIANYTIEVRLNPQEKRLEGKEIVEWRNAMRVPTRELWFHLYYNAWKNNQSTWMREDSLRRPRRERKLRREDSSYCSVKSIKVLRGWFAEADLTSQMRFAAPDDDNPNDETVLVVHLPRPVGPGETIKVEIVWESKIPRTFSRTGFRGNFFFIAQWFPKLGVYQADGTWNCHQFHAATEFFSDYGVYDVRLTVPTGWRVGATGREQGVTDNPDGTSTHHYRQADVHDFAWTTSPDYREARQRFESPGLNPVEMRLLYQPEHESQVERHFRAAAATLQYYGTWYGPYPYDHVTLIDPAWGSGAGGMEYPTLFTCGTRYFNPEGGGAPESVTVHEAGHQFWYAIVGNNEFEHAWLDEGLNTFSQARVLEAAFGERAYGQRFFRGFFPVLIPDILWRRMTQGNRLEGYRRAARAEAQATPTFLYYPASASAITYNKTALWLATLEQTVGWEAVRNILSTFFERWKFRHPTPDDFFAEANQVAGQDLTPFFDQVHRKAAVFDYGVDSVLSQEVKTEGYVEQEGKLVYQKGRAGEPKLYEARVVVRRFQDGILPVEVLLKFENGEEVRDVWDGESLWKLYTVVKPAKLAHAAVDPEHKLLLDINYTNNSRLFRSRAGLPATKWASKWMIWLQDYLQTLAFLF